jgi:hypothetical protein
VFAYQTKQQAGLFLKDLVPLAAIGSAYAWRDGTSDRHAHALTRAHARIPHQIDYEHEQEQEWNGTGVCYRRASFRIAQLDLAGSGLVAKLIKRGFATCEKPANF